MRHVGSQEVPGVTRANAGRPETVKEIQDLEGNSRGVKSGPEWTMAHKDSQHGQANFIDW